MQYKIVTLQEKTVAGLSSRTNNLSPQMGEVIGGLWKSFYGEDCYPAVKNKVGGSSFGIYTDYDDDEKGDYTVLAACEISAVDGLPEGVVGKVRRVFNNGRNGYAGSACGDKQALAGNMENEA